MSRKDSALGGGFVSVKPISAVHTAFAAATNRLTFAPEARKVSLGFRVAAGGAGPMPLLKLLPNASASLDDAAVQAIFDNVTAPLGYMVYDPKLGGILGDEQHKTDLGISVSGGTITTTSPQGFKTIDVLPVADDGTGISPSNAGVAAVDVDVIAQGWV